ncbi:chemosensory pili system protein ChpA (sensor histidine kinase/response regulator) [Pseudomonas sp. BIGb0408]|uniref:Chemotaxis protein CheA n=1 Tax=Phytopseudomonas flavescens TaxID=29435 RepID=A0A7Y9XR70_9GAMM|nr:MULTISPECIES: Hpt domain-containing protein [Pseudomonas]MCW2294763.1 chemosensory pili system protein ChpA (sensor histidine kinase/response regulator) [Pseudomonas sp. BIGb0408]NYH75963.1 chemosensory pili system protein ChpA (sensor histidine kinase/response regulator) [Pseudomonas flavescens]
MGDRHDYVALEWVKGEIAETLKQARQALEAFVENPQDSTRMRFCQTYVHQVHGTLQMVEFFGAALLAEEMEHLSQALIDGRVANQGEALEVLMQAILQLPIYLDRIQTARRDLPMVVLPLLNDLRAARGEKLLSETSLFSPDLSARASALSPESLTQLRTAELPALLRKLRQMLQVALVGVIRQQDLGTNLGYMARVFARLETLCKDSPLESLWQIASGVVEGLSNGSVANGTSVRTLLRQVDKELKRLTEQGADGINQPAPDELTKNLLFYVAKASPQSPRNRVLRDRYSLDDALPDHDVVDEERARLAGPDRDAMRSVVGALCEELVRVKDSLDLFVRSDRAKVADLEALLVPLKQIADTLAVLGFAQPRKVIVDQLDVVRALAQGAQEPSDAVLMDVAGALLYVEATLTGMVGQNDSGKREESHLPTTDVGQIHQLVIKEARNGLEQAKDAIIEFIASQWNHEHLARVPELLTQVRGGLAMIPLDRAAALLNACNRYIQEQLLARKAVPNWQNLDTLADAITSVEYYLERLSEDHATQGDLILDVAEESLAALGYPLQEKPSILDAASFDEEPAPLDDPLHDIDVLAAPVLDSVVEEPAPRSDEAPLAEALPADEPALELGDPDTAFTADDSSSVADDSWPQSDDAQPQAPLAAEPEAAWSSAAQTADTEEQDHPRADARASVADDSWPQDNDELPRTVLSAEPETAPPTIDLGDLDEDPYADAKASIADDSWSLDDSDLLVDEPDRSPLTLDDAALSAAEPVDLGELDALSGTDRKPSLADDGWSFDLDEQSSGLSQTPDLQQPQGAAEDTLWSLEELETRLDLVDIDRPANELPALDLPSEGFEEQPLELESLDLDTDTDVQWDDVDLADLQLPEVELPGMPEPAVLEAPAADKAISMADVMAAPVQAINPPALDVPPSLLPPPADEEPIDEELREVFIEEAGEVLETIAEFLPRWCADTEDREALIEVRRAFHTLKGSGRMVRALVIGELGWSIENLLNRVLDRSIQPGAEVQQVIGQVVALMPELVDEFAAQAQRQRDDVDRLAADAHALAKGLSLPKHDAPAAAVAEPAGEIEAAAAVVDESEVLDPQLLEIFRNEAETHLETLSAFLDDCARELPQPVTDDLQRALHTLKGSAYMAGILPMAEVAAPLEKMVKEFKANLLPLDLAEAEVLVEAQALFRQGLAQLESDPLRPLPGTEAYLERVQQLHDKRIQHAESQRQDVPGESRDPQLISIFLAEGMDILLDAEDLLRRWREHPSERQELSALLEELTTLGRGAEMAELPQIDELCEALLDLYGAVEDGSLAVSERFFDEAEQAHEALVSMMDQVAAGLEVSASPERVAALRALFDEALDPAKLALLSGDVPGLQVVELDEATRALEESLGVDAANDESSDSTLPVDAADDELVSIFLEEAVDILDSAGLALERWLAEPDNRTALSSLQRDLHTLKGGANMAGVVPIGELAHELEALYEGLVDRRYGVSPFVTDSLQQGHALLVSMLNSLHQRQPAQHADELVTAIRQFRQRGGQDELAVETHVPPSPEPLDAFEPQPEDTAPIEPYDAPLIEPLNMADNVQPAEPLQPQQAAVSDDRDPELVEIFLEEGFDIIDSAGAALSHWMDDVDNSLDLESLQRDLHTLKGGARMAEIREIGDLAHELEFLYEDLGNGRLRASPMLFELLQACHDRLAEMLDAVRAHRPVPGGDELIETIRRLRANPDEQLSMPTAVPLRAVHDEAFDNEEDILDIFLEEADELLEAMEAGIGRWEERRDDTGAIDELLRVLHTLKGGARLAGQKHLGDQSHDLEQHLTEAQIQGAPWPESLYLDVQSGFEGLQKSLDELRLRLQQQPVDERPAEPEQAPVRAVTSIVAASEQPVAHAQHRVLPFVQRAEAAAEEAASRRAPQELVKVPADLLEGLVNLAGETSIFRGRVEQQVSDFGFTLSEMEATIDRVRDQLRRLDTETQAQILSRYQAEAERAGYEDFDPLEMDRHSQLQQLSRALFESASDLLDLKETLASRNRDAETLLLQQARVNTELQEGLMRTRMVPFDRLVPRLRRIVRQVASELGKQVEFIVGNADGEMDRTVLERIVAPLEHMLRNAVDHGIESTAARRDAGKPEQGSIRLGLSREGGDIVLTLSDDGAGINLDAVRRKAIERGLMDAGADLSEHEILQFILEAGFSTAEKVTQISGRGVGMDVVNAEVKQLGGSMSIDSVAGQGTTFRIRLPFTVSVNRALMVLSGEDLYAIPLNTIEGIVRVSPYELEAYYGPDAPRFEYAGQAYELRYLGDLLNNGQHPKLVGQSLPLPVILVRSSEHTVAVQVDSLAGSREIVVKSLGPQFATVHGISGATILGDGRVVVILDLLATIRELHAHLQYQVRPRLSADAGAALEAEVERPTLVMVVDDSVTVRKVTSRLLERNGMNVLTAKDGVDAIAQLQEHRPDIMLLDIEMPRMDGFEVANLIRHDEGLKDLPIIMITSRTGEKHRERAVSIGVNEYLGKPYQESLLLSAIEKWAKRP